MSKRPTQPRKQPRSVPDAPADAARVSLHGASFEDVLAGLLTVDPDDLPVEEADDGDAP